MKIDPEYQDIDTDICRAILRLEEKAFSYSISYGSYTVDVQGRVYCKRKEDSYMVMLDLLRATREMGQRLFEVKE